MKIALTVCILLVASMAEAHCRNDYRRPTRTYSGEIPSAPTIKVPTPVKPKIEGPFVPITKKGETPSVVSKTAKVYRY